MTVVVWAALLVVDREASRATTPALPPPAASTMQSPVTREEGLALAEEEGASHREARR